MRVLVVEDERRLADNIARSLRESAGYAVDIAADGHKGYTWRNPVRTIWSCWT